MLRERTRATQNELAQHFHARTITRRTFRALRQAAARGAERQRMQRAAVRKRYLALLRVPFAGWKSYIAMRREKMEVWRSAEQLHEKFIVRKCIEVWQVSSIPFFNNLRLSRFFFLYLAFPFPFPFVSIPFFSSSINVFQ